MRLRAWMGGTLALAACGRMLDLPSGGPETRTDAGAALDGATDTGTLADAGAETDASYTFDCDDFSRGDVLDGGVWTAKELTGGTVAITNGELALAGPGTNVLHARGLKVIDGEIFLRVTVTNASAAEWFLVLDPSPTEDNMESVTVRTSAVSWNSPSPPGFSSNDAALPVAPPVPLTLEIRVRLHPTLGSIVVTGNEKPLLVRYPLALSRPDIPTRYDFKLGAIGNSGASQVTFDDVCLPVGSR